MKKITFLLSFIVCAVLANSTYAASTLPVTVDLSTAVGNNWTYISNDPTGYPNPTFYTTAGALGLKLNFEQMGIQSPEFTPSTSLSVTLNVNALNQNTKTGSSSNYFTITGLDATGSIKATAFLTSVVKGVNTVILTGSDMVKVKIIMTGYPNDGTKFCNVNLASTTIDKGPTGIKEITNNKKLDFTVSNNKLSITSAPSTNVEIFNTVGAKVKNLVLVNNEADLNLAKGVYIVRCGNATGKIML